VKLIAYVVYSSSVSQEKIILCSCTH